MKYFTIVKYHPCVQLAHAYEHLFVSTITEYLYQHNRYKLLDYSLNGETYESGIIVINGECYNNESEKLLNNIATMKADLGSEKIWISAGRASDIPNRRRRAQYALYQQPRRSN